MNPKKYTMKIHGCTVAQKKKKNTCAQKNIRIQNNYHNTEIMIDMFYNWRSLKNILCLIEPIPKVLSLTLK